MFTWIANVIQHGGVWGVFLLMALENVFPPLPSELIMPMAGYVVGSGGMSLVGCVLAGTAGSAASAVVWYALGRWIGLERLRTWSQRHGRWLTLSLPELDRAVTWFQKWGVLAVLIGRTLPGVRGVICIPAGVAQMNFSAFLLASTLGSLIWSALLTGAGMALASHYNWVQHWLNPVADVFLVLCGGIYLFRVVTFRAGHER